MGFCLSDCTAVRVQHGLIPQQLEKLGVLPVKLWGGFGSRPTPRFHIKVPLKKKLS